ncbi:ABC transporter substrate-binding protein [Diplocloster agilis]|uniref:Sugar ABC transporter substrate-binding protein n=1 Tax=Diplocloster agilis TaxID=2850323 RepID=A0A949JXN8_9FIRM|nr:sugar ABC transporter substrate-binding protein [Diplocloster agilis]MBU9737105.1 sugar ABC transporter substrate-binding protein [Diplocloster agilis]MBU9746542.1 sugar ABC transporter substrate-binding protein [Diplocloster agilis]
MSRFKKMKVFMIAAAMMIALSACGSSADQAKETNTADSKTEEKDSSATAADSGSEKVELRFLLWGNQEEIDKKTQWTEEFNAENDKIHVNLEAIPEGFHEKLTVQISSGTLADLVQIAGDFGGEYFKDGLLAPLDSYIERDGLQDAWVDTLMSGLSYNGSVYAAPTSFNSGFIIYNKTMFEENNIPLPTNDWTEEEFLAAAKALTKGEGDDKVWGADFSSWWAYSLARNLYDGYKAWEWETGTMTADTQGFRDGVQFITDLYQVHKVSPTPTMAADVGGTFENGKFAMTIGASWDMASFNQAIGDNFEWDIVTFPSNPTYGQWRSPLWTTAIGMSADTPYKDECWEYISYMSAQNKVQSEMELIGLPALKSISEDSEFMNTIPEGWKPFNKEVFYDALDYAVDGVVLNEIQDEIIKYELELLFAGEQDIDTTLENIQTKGQLKLDRMKEE